MSAGRARCISVRRERLCVQRLCFFLLRHFKNHAVPTFGCLRSLLLGNFRTAHEQKRPKVLQYFFNGEQPLWQLSSEALYSPWQAGVFQKDSATETRQNLDLHLTEEVRKTLEAFDAHFRDALKMHAPKAAYHPLVKEPDDPTFPCSLKVKVNACGPNACRFWQDDQTPLGDIRTVKTAGAKIVPIINFSKAWFMGTQCGVTAELRAAVISHSTGATATDVFPL